MEQYSDLLDCFVEQSKCILGGNLVGIYLHGSAAMGCFHAKKSDIDLLIVVRNGISNEVKRLYMDMAVALNGRASEKGIEFSIVRADVCNPFVYPTPFELHFSMMHLGWYQSNPTDYIEKMNGTDKDLAAHITVLYHRGKKLYGEEIKTIFSEVDRADYFDSIWGDVENAKEEIAANPMYFILNLCRVLAYKKENLILSKLEGGAWGLANVSTKYVKLIEDAMAEYRTGVLERFDEMLAQEYAAYMLELLDDVEASGNILVSDVQNINFLFCNHPLYQRKVDEDYEEEYQAASLNHSCALFSYEDLERGKLSLYGADISGLTIYRGWMMKPELYETLYSMLEDKGIVLINTPKEYRRYHLLPEWYPDFETETAASVWEEDGSLENALEMAKGLTGSYMVKDYVKSRKHEWYDACFIENISDRVNASKVIQNFIERQGTSIVGGVVLRKFEHLKQIGFHEKSGMPLSEEYRVFLYAGHIMILDDYWTDKSEVKITDDERKWIESIAQRVKSNFVTVDFARKEDGSLMIMEFGDGQVSGLQQIRALDFYHAFEQCKRRN